MPYDLEVAIKEKYTEDNKKINGEYNLDLPEVYFGK